MYIVYEHWLDGKCIYVGSGKLERAYSYKRNKSYNETVSDREKDIVVKIVAEFESKIESFQYEEGLTKFYFIEGQPLKNIRSGTKYVYGELHPQYGLKRREETIRILSEQRKGKSFEDRSKNPEKWRHNISKVTAGENNPRSRKIVVINNNNNKEKIFFNYIKESYKYFENIMSSGTIKKCLKTGFIYKGYEFKYLEENKNE